MEDYQKALSHFGVPVMKWGHRRSVAKTAGILSSTKKMYEDASIKKAAGSDMASGRSKMATAGAKTIGKSLRSQNAKAKSERLADESKQMANKAKGVAKASKLVAGMDKNKALSTLESAAKYTKAQKIVTALI